MLLEHKLSLALFILTAVLLLLAEAAPRRRLGRLAVLLAFPTVLAADAFLLLKVPDWGIASSEIRPMASRPSRRSHGGGGASGGAEPEYDEAAAERGRGGSGASADGADDDNASSATLQDRIIAILSPARPQPTSASHYAGEAFAECVDCPEVVVVPAGTTRIGADPRDQNAEPVEGPPRQVRIWPGFALSRHEITEAEFARAGIRSPAATQCQNSAAQFAPADRRPAVCVTAGEAEAYARWLTGRTGKRYRLPSAAEWEFAVRSAANVPSGLVAMSGGVAEIVADCWHTRIPVIAEQGKAYHQAEACDKRLIKDGADQEEARWRRASSRRALAMHTRSPLIGFRVLRELD